MQDYKQLDPTEPLNKSIPSMMESLNSVASGFSGTAFPTENLYVGMRCVRTDQNTEYICTKVENGKAEWADINKLTLHAGQAETDGSGNNIEQTYLKKGEAESTYITSNRASEIYFPKTTGEGLGESVQKNSDAINNISGNIESLSSEVENLSKNMANIGDIAYRPFLMDGWVKANGATVNRSDYPELVNYVNRHNLWTSNKTSEPYKFGNGNGSTTMVLPDYRNRFIEGGDAVGVKSAGLPNIVGTFSDYSSSYYNNASGAFYHINVQSGINGVFVKQDIAYSKWAFSAQNANSIYGASDTVQPSAIVLIPQIKY